MSDSIKQMNVSGLRSPEKEGHTRNRVGFTPPQNSERKKKDYNRGVSVGTNAILEVNKKDAPEDQLEVSLKTPPRMAQKGGLSFG
jgi:hypothetical protein